MEERKTWTKPQLVILGKGQPEENVLKHCKHLAQSGPITAGCRGRGKGNNGACSGLGQS